MNLKNIIWSTWLVLAVQWSSCVSAQSNVGINGGVIEQPAVPEIIPPSPSVSSLIKFEEMPVNFYTGIPSISESLVKLPVDGSLELSISLDYHPSGIRLEEYAPWVGTGWSLSGAGGFVSRTVKGAPDDEGGILNNGYYNSSYTTNTGLFDQINYDAVYVGTGSFSDFNHDTKSDIFHFNFFGNSGKFLFTKNANGLLVPVLLDGKSNLKINVVHGPSLRKIESFELIDQNGYAFTFDQKEITNVISTSFSNRRGSGGVSAGGSNYNYVSSWHISKVQDPQGKIICQFTYQDVQEKTKSGSFTRNETIWDVNHPNFTNENDESLMLPYTSTNINELSVATKKLSLIEITGRGSLSFGITLGRADYEGSTGCRLDHITVFDATGARVEKSTFLYASKGPANRLFLEKLQKAGLQGSTVMEYGFDYKSPELLPVRNSYSRDIWGYFNGKHNFDPLPAIAETGTSGADMRTSQLHVTRGVLEGIRYPTGGYKKFNFESNTYSKVASEGKIYYDHPENRISHHEQLDFNCNAAASPNYKIIYMDQAEYINFNLAVTSYQQGSVHGPANRLAYKLRLTPLKPLYAFDPMTTAINPDKAMYVADTQQSLSEVLRDTYVLDMDDCSNGMATNQCGKAFFIKGFYLLEMRTDGVPQMQDIVNYRLNFSWFRYQENLKFNYGGGLRIGSVEYRNNIQDLVPARKFTYSYQDFNDATKSSGSMLGLPLFHYYRRAYWSGMTSNASHTVLVPLDDYYITTTTHSAVPHLSTNGSLVGYRNVTVADAFEGRKQYYYNAPENFPEPEYVFKYPFNVEGPDNDYKRGLLLREESYDVAGLPKSLTENTYEYVEENIFGGMNVAQKQYAGCHLHQSVFGDTVREYVYYLATITNPDSWTDGFRKISLCANMYTFLSLDRIDYVKGWAKLMSSKNTSFLDNGTIETFSVYGYNDVNKSVSYEESKIFDPITSFDFESSSKRYLYPHDLLQAGVQAGMMSALIAKNIVARPIEVQAYNNGLLTAKEHTLYKDWDPGSGQLLAPEVIQSSKGTGALEPRVRYNAMDIATGNPLEVEQAGGTKISYIWGYNKTQPIAKIENASNTEIKTALGVSDLALLNETDLVAINGLRSTLPNAMVTTYTYKPLVGMSTVTDPKGDRTTYEYDSLNRLQFVRDRDGHILSENQYRYRTQN